MKETSLKFNLAFRASLVGLGIMATAAHAQVTTIVVPFATGGPTDTSARMIATALARESGATFVVENVPGAGATIGATKVAQAKPDGYTLLWGSGSTLAMTPHLYPNLKYDPVKSFAPIGLVVAQPFILVTNASRNIKSVKELVALAKASPGKLNFSSTGQGASSHLVAELFKAATSVSATHIPYNGGAPGVNALLANDVDFFFDTPTTVVPLIKAGKLTGLAATGSKRWEAVPEVPTMQQSGFADFDATTWFGLAAPAGTPPERVAALSKSLLKVLADPQV
ncbi:MAG: tripartite tricarboxylate transporter substrate binding protein, partial [Haliea sp.]